MGRARVRAAALLPAARQPVPVAFVRERHAAQNLIDASLALDASDAPRIEPERQVAAY